MGRTFEQQPEQWQDEVHDGDQVAHFAFAASQALWAARIGGEVVPFIPALEPSDTRAPGHTNEQGSGSSGSLRPPNGRPATQTTHSNRRWQPWQHQESHCRGSQEETKADLQKSSRKE